MLGLLVLTHGGLAEELVAAAKKIVGPVDACEAISIDWDDDLPQARERIERAVRQLDQGQGVLLLTDMFGGSPTNLALSLLEPGRVEIVTGVNLPMLIKFTNHREKYSLADAAAAVVAEGRQAIHAATEILDRTVDDGSGGGT